MKPTPAACGSGREGRPGTRLTRTIQTVTAGLALLA